MASSQIPALSSTFGGNGGSHSSRSTSLVRSKSLRLPSATRKSAEPNVPGSPSTLTRHGSMRVSRTQNPIPTSISAATLSSTMKQTSKKPPPPPVKPKPSLVDKTGEKVYTFTRPALKPSLSDEERSARTTSPKSEREQTTVVKSVGFENAQVNNGVERHQNGAAHNQPSMSRDVGISLDVGHWRRLTEEHEKLQMEYARLRMQHMDNAASKLMSSSQFGTRKDANSLHTAYSDTHLDTIPEDGPSSLNKLRGVLSDDKQQYMEEYVQQLESLVQGYRAEVLRVQEECRKTQRKYWDNVMSGQQSSQCTSEETTKQVSELLDKLEEKQNEVNQLNSKVQTMSSQLASTHEELQKCHNALQDYQYQIESGEHERTELEKRLRDLRGDLSEARESVEFLQAERTTLAETLQETEQALRTCRAQWEKDKATFQDVAHKHRKLYAKVQDKNLNLQILQAELEATEGRARDMLLSQGAQLTLGAVSVSQLSSRISTVLASILDYAAVDLGLEKEVNSEIIGDGDEFGPDLHKTFKVERVRLPNEDSDGEKHHVMNGRLPSSSSEESSPTSELPPSEPRGRSTSLVQTIIQALEQSSKSSTANNSRCTSPTKQPVSRISSLQSDGEKTNGTKEFLATSRTKDPPGDLDTKSVEYQIPPQGYSSGPPGSPSKPVGMATAFRTGTKGEITNGHHSDTAASGGGDAAAQDEESSSLECQAKQANVMLNKLVAVLTLIQKTYSQQLKEKELENFSLQGELQRVQESKLKLEHELADRITELEEVKTKAAASILDTANVKEKHATEVTNYQEEISKLRTKIRSLEAINAEQARQMKEEVFKLVRTAGPANSAVGDAMAICDKLVLRQEITKLKEMLKEKEDLLKQLSGKFTRHKKVWEGNLQKAELEVSRLDDIIEKVITIMQEIPEVVQGCEPLGILLEQLKSGSAYGESFVINGSGSASMEGSFIMTSSTDLV